MNDDKRDDCEEYEPYQRSPREGEIRWIDGVKYEFSEGMWVEV